MRIRPYRTLANFISGVVITFNDVSEQKRQQDHLQILMKELQHRTNNLFTVIQAMARQTARSSASFAGFEEQFGARVHRRSLDVRITLATRSQNRCACFAGIWTNWTSVRRVKEGETTNDLYAFLTTEPNAEVGAIHPKAMPVILTSPDEVETWMTAPPDEALKLQRPLPDGTLRIVARGVKEDVLSVG
jgi:hypothetical protein